MIPRKRYFLRLICIILITVSFSYCIINLIKKVKTKDASSILLQKAEYYSADYYNSGTTYYVSCNGTSKDGTNIEDPMPFSEVNKKVYYGNDRVLLKRGDTFYGLLNFNVEADESNLFYIGAYGDENLEKPIISGAATLINNQAWEMLDGVYRLDLSDYNNNFVGYKDQAYNVGFFEDEEGNIYGNRKATLDSLMNEFDFFCDKNYIYVKSLSNPSDLLGKIKFSFRNDIVKIPSNTIMENICIENTGAHGIRNKNVKNILIKDCIIKNIGGSYQSGTTRYGNGIEFWDGAENTVVTNCIIKNTYDTGYTLQGTQVTELGFRNNVCQNNIFINCTYATEFFAHNNSDTTYSYLDNNKIENNLIINQGRGWGYETRPGEMQAANLVASRLPDRKDAIQYNHNTIFNSRLLYYKNYATTKETYMNIINSNYNKYYLSDDTIFFADKEYDEKYYYNRDILSDYGLDEDSEFINISNEDVNLLSNKRILNSTNYEEILEYYNNFCLLNKNKDNFKNIIENLKNIKQNKKYSNIFNNNEVNTKFENLINNLESFFIDCSTVNKDNLLIYFDEIYDIVNTIIEELDKNNIENFINNQINNLIYDIENLNEDFEPIFSNYSIDDDISSNQIIKKLNETIVKYNNDIDIVNNAKDTIIKAKNLYIEKIQNKEKYINYINKKKINNLCNIANRLMEYDLSVEEEKSKVKVIYDKDKNIKTTEKINVTLLHGNDTKIINNNGSEKYTFEKNGSFTFRLSIKGKTHALAIRINNIAQINKTSLEMKEMYKKEYKSENIETVKQSTINEKTILIILGFTVLGIFSYIKYKKLKY